MNRSNKFCHPAHDDERQQQCSCSNNSRVGNTSSSRNTWQVYFEVYKYIHTRTSYNSSVQYNYSLIKSRCSVVKLHRCLTRHMISKKRYTIQNKKENTPGIERSTSCSQGVQATY